MNFEFTQYPPVTTFPPPLSTCPLPPRPPVLVTEPPRNSRPAVYPSTSWNHVDQFAEDGVPIKQSWSDFCHEQETVRSVKPNSYTETNATMPYRPTSTMSSESFVSTTSVGGRPQFSSNNKWHPRYQKRFRNVYDSEPLLKTTRKRKRPLSQNVPTRKDWSLEDATRALAIEKECNKRNKSSLIIKFPDLEINRDIVASYHPEIENVHFQQPSTPRYCFITLKDISKAEEVICSLSNIKFGDRYLTVELKKDKDEDQIVSASDVDPYTLYVGNLAQDITKDDMIKLYPNSRRIDIGYAKKMKYTRYAFVVFRTIEAAIDSFKRTHNHQIYDKSLIVRFRRLHGTVGMPGDSKQQNPPKPPMPSEDQATKTNDIEAVAERPVVPFIVDIKQETEIDFERDEEYGDDAYSFHGHMPKTVKIEVKSEINPEAYHFVSDNRVVRVKTEVKPERRSQETQDEEEDNEDDDLESQLDLCSAFYRQDEGFSELLNQYVARDRQTKEL